MRRPRLIRGRSPTRSRTVQLPRRSSACSGPWPPTSAARGWLRRRPKSCSPSGLRLPRASSRSTMRLSSRLLGPVQAVAGAAEREARRMVLGAVGTAADSQIAGEVIERVLASPLVERAARQALGGPLPAVIAHDVVEYRLVER